MDDAAARCPVGQKINQPPSLYIIPDNHCRKLANADALKSSQPQRNHIFRDQQRLIGNFSRGAVRTKQVPFKTVVG